MLEREYVSMKEIEAESESERVCVCVRVKGIDREIYLKKKERVCL